MILPLKALVFGSKEDFTKPMIRVLFLFHFQSIVLNLYRLL